jgi:hypothetical protein
MNAKLAATVVAFFFCACGGSTSTPRSTDAGTGTGGLGTGGAGTGGGSSGTGGAGASGGGMAGTGGNACNPACGTGRDCCGGHCVNLNNDLLNCGKCGKACDKGTYCTGGQCVTPPCQTTCGGGAQCCDMGCCAAGELCCDQQGPVERGPVCSTPANGTCPMGCAPLCKCASPDTPIATPEGNKPIAGLRIGDLVYSVDHGKVTLVPIVRTNRSPVRGHAVVRVVLAGGGILEISALHPTADGRTFGGLTAGDRLDGIDIVSTTTVPYSHDATYDILPDSDSGAYFADGVLVGSTLATRPVLVVNATAPSEGHLRSIEHVYGIR